MKILIGSLLFATAIFINFPELNSSPQPSSRAGPSRRNSNLERHQQQHRVPKHIFIKLYNQQIQVDIELIGGRYEAVSCEVIYPILKIPTNRSKGNMNFMTQADFKRVGQNFIRIVIYVQEDHQKVRRLLGAKLPPTGHDGYKEGDPRSLNPDANKWFITYEGVEYEVAVDFVSQNLLDIKLYNNENYRPSHETIIEMWHQIPYIHFCGVYFLVFKDDRNIVQGAALDPFWKYRPGEEFEYLNPHDHLQPHPQPNRPIEQDPEPQQNLDQQHLLGQQQNLNPYQSLDQNPYPHHHQTFDLNQQYVQQDGFQLPYFDPNQNYAQEDVLETPRFRSRQNRHYQSHPPPGP